LIQRLSTELVELNYGGNGLKTLPYLGLSIGKKNMFRIVILRNSSDYRKPRKAHPYGIMPSETRI